MVIQIKNNPPLTEKIIAYIIAVVCITLGVGQIVSTATGDITTGQITGVIIFFTTVVLGFVIIWFAGKERGTLWINQETRTFSFNIKEWFPYEDLTFYETQTINTPVFLMRFFYQSRMIVRLGVDEKNSFRIPDNRGSLYSMFGSKSDEVEALQDLVNGSSLSSDEKESFSNWVARTNIANGNDLNNS